MFVFIINTTTQDPEYRARRAQLAQIAKDYKQLSDDRMCSDVT